jgi:hypothetical protein
LVGAAAITADQSPVAHEIRCERGVFSSSSQVVRGGARYSTALAIDPTTAAEQEPATQDLLAAPAGERCANCEAPLASDQRYCVECGQRRSGPRFSFETLTAPPATTPAPKLPSRIPRVSSSMSFIAGIATLLLALGVGVLIGHNNPKTTQAAAPSQVIKIQGLGGNGSSANKPASNSGFKAPTVPKLSKKVVKKVQAAASTVLGSGTKNLSNNVTQQVGQSCSGGAGCQGHKFTGNFFGGG